MEKGKKTKTMKKDGSSSLIFHTISFKTISKKHFKDI